MRAGFRTKVSVPFVLPQTRHPERSAPQMDRVTKRSLRAVEGPRRCLFTHAARSFSTTEARRQDLLRHAFDWVMCIFLPFWGQVRW